MLITQHLSILPKNDLLRTSQTLTRKDSFEEMKKIFRAQSTNNVADDQTASPHKSPPKSPLLNNVLFHEQTVYEDKHPSLINTLAELIPLEQDIGLIGINP